MICPRCGLDFFRPDRTGSWMCMACGHMPFDGQWLAAAVITGAVLALLIAHGILAHPIVLPLLLIL